MSHKPRGFVLNAEGALQLVAAASLLAGTYQVNRLQPLMKRNLAALKDCADSCRELLAAVFALVDAGAMRCTVKGIMDFAYAATVRAYRAIRPADGLKVLARFVSVLEVRLV